MVVNGFSSEINCSKCNKTINDALSLCEFMNKFYHIDCFRCKYCDKSLTIPINGQICGPLPMLDQYDGSLVCMDDYIRSLKCKICTKNFDLNSKIHPICGTSPNGDECLAHVECFKCKLCKIELKETNEYYFDLNENMLCRPCTIDSYSNQKCKRKMKSSDRLSSKQKETIKKKLLFVENFDDLNLDLDDFASQIDCTLKCLLKYVDKQFNKKTKIIIDDKNENLASVDIINTRVNCDNMMEQLRKLDKTVAPNKNPFSIIN
jgi:hypothetical protein